MYHSKNRGEEKAYINFFSCSLTREIHLELLSDQMIDEFTEEINYKKMVSWNNLFRL